MNEQVTVSMPKRGRPTKYNYEALSFSTVNENGTITGDCITTKKEGDVISARSWGKRHGVKIVGKYDSKTGKYQIFKLKADEVNPEK